MNEKKPKPKKTKLKLHKPISEIECTKLDIHASLIINGIIIAVLFFSSIYLFVMASQIDTKNKKLVLAYNDQSDIAYEVILKPNPYYGTPTLGMNQQYPTALIDNIRINYKYNFNASNLVDYTYRYHVVATLEAKNKMDKSNNNRLFYKEYVIANEIIGNQEDSTTYTLNKDFFIDYDIYNNLIVKYKNQFNLNVEASLKVTMYIDLVGKYQNEVIKRQRNMEVTIPLITNPISITSNKGEDLQTAIYDEENAIQKNNYYLIFAVIMGLTSILLLIQELRKVWKSDQEQSKYLKQLNRLIAPNAEVIVKVKNKIDLKQRNIIDVESMSELLDAQSELRIPIAYYETKENKEGYFVIVNGQEIWRYIFKVKDD